MAEGEAGTCEGPQIMARALRHLQRERGHTFPAHLVAAAGRRKLGDEAPAAGSGHGHGKGAGANAGAGLLFPAPAGAAHSADGQLPQQQQQRQSSSHGHKRARLAPSVTDGVGSYPPCTPSLASGALLDGSSSSSSQQQQKQAAAPPPPQPSQQDAASLTVGEEGSTGAAAPMLEADAEEEEEEEEEDVGAAARGFREAWGTLLGQAVVAGGWPAEGQEPLAVRAVAGAVAPLLERAERSTGTGQQQQQGQQQGQEEGQEEGREALATTVADLEWAHKVVAAGMGALSDRVRVAVEKRWRGVEGLQGECWAVVAATPLARDPQLVAMVAARRPGWEGAALEGLLALAGKKEVVEDGNGNGQGEEKDKGNEEAEDVAAAAAAVPSGVVEGKEGSQGAEESTTTTTTINHHDNDPTAAVAAAAAAAIERLRPLARRLANQRSLLEAGRAQTEDAAKAAWAEWGRLRRGLLAAARRGAGLAGPGGGGRTLLLYDARCAHHQVPEAHVEQPGRFLEASGAMRALAKEHPGRYVLRTQIADAYFPRACLFFFFGRGDGGAFDVIN